MSNKSRGRFEIECIVHMHSMRAGAACAVPRGRSASPSKRCRTCAPLAASALPPSSDDAAVIDVASTVSGVSTGNRVKYSVYVSGL